MNGQIAFIVVLVFVLIFFFVSKKFREVFYRKAQNTTTPLTEEEFYKQFEISEGIEPKWEALLAQAWQARNFEIDLYWKRANYFWLFQVPAFTAYFLLRKPLEESINRIPIELFVVTCLGVVFSLAWFLINKGSKMWQTHWEVHIDLLEIKLYGSLYQTVYHPQMYSLTRINEIVSLAFMMVWISFPIIFLLEKDLLQLHLTHLRALQPAVCFTLLGTIMLSLSMLKGYGLGLFEERSVMMYKRKWRYENP